MEQRKPAVLCLVVETGGSTPRKSGSKMLVYSDGRIDGTIGGGNIEKELIAEALNALKTGENSLKTFQLSKDLEMQCGGKMTVYIEPLVCPPQLVIFGAGHISGALAKMAAIAGFSITVADDRKGIFESWEQKNVSMVEKPFDEAIKSIDFNQNSYIVVCTYLHESDLKVVAGGLFLPHKYLGMIGSKRKIEKTATLLEKDFGFTKDQIQSIDMPIGIPIACETPEEIAVSILARLVDVRNS